MTTTPNLYCVRANYGQYADAFRRGGYVAIGWLTEDDLSEVDDKAAIYPLYRSAHPEDDSSYVVGTQVGQIARFRFEISPGDYVITPDRNTERLHYGVVKDVPYEFFTGEDGCPYRHRRPVAWAKHPVRRDEFSVPFQNSARATLTVFRIKHRTNFFQTIGKPDLVPPLEAQVEVDYYKSVLNRILELDDREFEILVTHILSAVGFDGSEHTGKPHDGGVDARGELNVAGMAKIKLFVQAKRYQLGARITARTVKALRANIPAGGQGAFITTAGYQKKAKAIATEPGFPRIGLIDGEKLVDILAEHWEDIPEAFREQLGLKVGLIPG